MQLEAHAAAMRGNLADLGERLAAQRAAAAQQEQSHCLLQVLAERLQADVAGEATARRYLAHRLVGSRLS